MLRNFGLKVGSTTRIRFADRIKTLVEDIQRWKSWRRRCLPFMQFCFNSLRISRSEYASWRVMMSKPDC